MKPSKEIVSVLKMNKLRNKKKMKKYIKHESKLIDV